MIERIQNIIITLKAMDKESQLRSSWDIYGQGPSTDQIIHFFNTGEIRCVGLRDIWRWYRKSKPDP